MKKFLVSLIVFGCVALMADTFKVTIRCSGDFFKKDLESFLVDFPYYPDGYGDAKRWAKQNGDRLCRKYGKDGCTAYDGIYSVERK